MGGQGGNGDELSPQNDNVRVRLPQHALQHAHRTGSKQVRDDASRPAKVCNRRCAKPLANNVTGLQERQKRLNRAACHERLVCAHICAHIRDGAARLPSHVRCSVAQQARQRQQAILWLQFRVGLVGA
jgi:hypothetical protein